MTDAVAVTVSPVKASAFFVSKKVIKTFLAREASAHQICIYLVFAQFTEKTGCFSSATLNAVSKYVGGNKSEGFPLDRALKSLKGKKVADYPRLPKFVIDRATWLQQRKGTLPDGPTHRAEIKHILTEEDAPNKVGFSANLVLGFKDFYNPLSQIKAKGDLLARVLIYLYMVNDMEGWTGLNPHLSFYRKFRQTRNNVNCELGITLIMEQSADIYIADDLIKAVLPNSIIDSLTRKRVREAIETILEMGFAYEMVMTLDRERRNDRTFEHLIPSDASPLYELDCRSLHGYKPTGEEGMASATAKLAGQMRHSVTEDGGTFGGMYAAFLPKGQAGMIAGIYRLRFRVSNSKLERTGAIWCAMEKRKQDANNIIGDLTEKYGWIGRLTPSEFAAWQKSKDGDVKTNA